MENGRLTQAIARLVQHILDSEPERSDALTVKHLRLKIRSERMTEASNWSEEDLDLVEVHAAQFDGSRSLDEIVSVPKHAALPCREAVGAINAPSPFAWT